MVTVSTRNWGSARSGAPCSTKITAMPYPDTPTSTIAVSRRCERAANTAEATMTAPATSWTGLSQSRIAAGQGAPRSSPALPKTTRTIRMTPT